MNDTPSVLFDTSVATENAGDEIIMEAVQRELRSASGDAFFVRIATHDYPGSTGRRWIRKSDLCIVGGTNLLSSHFFRYRQWKFSPWDAFLLRQKV
ncbi:MAG TPA: polysaccharide pyruvyl transferase family protein, partial [Fibrobacteria bacterium]|nr:polysaccharide pyruvyl transferase family protein [Fibrobacteria bacterium]